MLLEIHLPCPDLQLPACCCGDPPSLHHAPATSHPLLDTGPCTHELSPIKTRLSPTTAGDTGFLATKMSLSPPPAVSGLPLLHPSPLPRHLSLYSAVSTARTGRRVLFPSLSQSCWLVPRHLAGPLHGARPEHVCLWSEHVWWTIFSLLRPRHSFRLQERRVNNICCQKMYTSSSIIVASWIT